MPISPENMKLYPGGSIRSPEWLAIRERIRRRADDKCEQCGIGNHNIGIRYGGDFIVMMPGDLGGTATVQHEGSIVTGKVIQIVCTVAHVDGKLTDHSDDNLRFWCQRCHLRHDATSHRANAAITIHDRRAGTKDMFK